MNQKLNNLTKELKSLIRSEKQVIYILSEIRKKLELDQIPSKRYSTLYMYCCWVLHTKLDRKDAIDFLKTINFDNTEGIAKIALETFREELQSFLIENNLPEEITKDEWFQFRKYFLYIISEIPLVNKKATGLEVAEFCLVVPFGEIAENNRFLYKATYGNGEVREMGILVGDYDRMTKRELDREDRKFWRRRNMKILGRRIEHAKTLKGEQGEKFKEETEKIYQRMKREEQNDEREDQDDMMINLVLGGLNN
ncbi:MAG: hypothetical protein K9M36_01765 [Candidatus Pacebacteria bacterium]|nr:hypothetical protein [Candidatus Paceibacterota bacterium]